MKPILLEMTAFGPYKQTEVIDFRQLGEHLLFAISGNTGAGKTTIFDAICYGLYGEASGEERNDTKGLRSHFATDDVSTSVGFQFSLKDKEYYIYRQMPHRKAGNKSETGGAVEFYEIIEKKKIPCVDRFHVLDVKEKIHSILGLTKAQFSQIVMLPQGEFGKLLTSETENKEEILRRVFHTNLYQKIREVLDEKRKEKKKIVDNKEAELQVHYRHVESLDIRDNSLLEKLTQQEHKNIYQVLEALDEEKGYYQAVYQQRKEAITAQEKAWKEANEQFQLAKQVNEQFALLAQKQQQHQALKEEEAVITEKEQTLALAQKAEQLRIFEELFVQAKETNEQKQKDFATSEQKVAMMKAEVVKVTNHYEEEKQKEAIREQKKRERDQLEQIKAGVETLAFQEKQVQTLQMQTKKLTDQETNITEKIIQQEKQLLEQKQALEKMEQQLATLPAKQEKRILLQNHYKIVKSYLETKQQMLTQATKVKEAELSYVATKENYEQLEQQWLENQATFLAGHLHNGEPCPVCGSKEHPKKATATHGIERQALVAMKKKKDEAETIYRQQQVTLQGIEQTINQLAEEVVEAGYELEKSEAAYENILLMGKEIKVTLAQLQDMQIIYTQKKAENQQLDQQLAEARSEKEQISQTLQQSKLQLASMESAYQNQLSHMPETIRTTAQWTAAFQEVSRIYKQLQKAWNQAEKQYHHITKQQIEVEQQHQHISQQQKEAVEELEKKEVRFTEERKKVGFTSTTQYHDAKLSIPTQEQLKKEVETFKERLQLLAANIQQLEATLQGKEKMDVEALKNQVDSMEIELDIQKKLHHRTEVLLEQIDQLQRNITALHHELKDDMDMYQQVVDLFEVVKGNNESRISFERYILIEYLERIIETANIRLKKLSNGQFSLQRSERVEKRNKQSGLGLDVYDSYTGQVRDVKTLSGGEKFNASLCLALGMIDVIQNFQGGISIETMFIDEGFGSLDEESLDKAIDTLVELQQSGRFIGVISHVQELKNAMPAVLQITKTKEGYSKAKFILKD